MKKGGPRKKNRRRARGEGSVYHRESDNRWVATLVNGFTDAGRPKTKVFYGVTEKEAVKKRDAFREKLTLGQATFEKSSKQTVGQYLDAWLKARRGAAATKRRYEQLIAYRIKPFLGGYPLEMLGQRKVGPTIIKDWLAWLREQDEADPRPSKKQAGQVQAGTPGKASGKGADKKKVERPKRRISERGQEMALSVLRAALNNAEREDILPANPIRKVKDDRPRPPDPETKSMGMEQVATFFKAALPDPYYPLYVLALDSGMREGELFALEWPDLDLTARTVRVQRALKELDGKVEVLPCKTKRSRRVIELTRHTVAVLRAYQDDRKRLGFTEPLVFTAPEGGYLRRPNLARRFFRPTLEKAGLPRFRFHELRHTCATLLLMAGTPINVVSERLGHTTVAVTLKVYAHVLPGMQKHAAEKMDVLFEQALEAAKKTTTSAQTEPEQAAAVTLLEAVLDQALPEGVAGA